MSRGARSWSADGWPLLTDEPTPRERQIEYFYTTWDLERYRRPQLAERYWALLNYAVNEWCQENGYSHDEGWDTLRRKLDLRPR